MEQRAQQIIEQHFSFDVPSYKEVKNEHGYTGFMDIYLRYSKNDQSMSTSADYNVMLELASIDQFRNQNTTFNNIYKVTSFPKKVKIRIFLKNNFS